MIPSGYSRSVFSGSLKNGEIFAWSLWANEAPSDQAATQSQADNFAGDFIAIKDEAGTPLDLLDSQSGYGKVTVYSYLDATGKATHIAESPINQQGGGTGPELPNQCCVVATLLTGNAGRRSRGRIYLPCTSAQLGGGQLGPSLAQSIATWVGHFINGLNGDLGDQRIVVLSQKGGTSSVITATQVDTRIDIQRRRANKETIIGRYNGTIS